MPGHDVRRRILAIGIAAALAAIAAVLFLLRPAPMAVRPDLAAPASTAATPLAAATAPPSPVPSASASVSGSAQAPTGMPPPEATETPEAGETPAQPPAVPVPPAATNPPAEQEEPAPPFPETLRGQDVTVVPGAGRTVALTFDGGANAAGLPAILSTLAAKGVPATFFLTGSWVAANPGAVARIVADGHRVANHSMTHPGFTGLTDEAMAQEVRGAEQTILAAGADPRPLFRFPFGERDPRTIAAVNAMGYVAVRWTVDTLGWKGTSGGAGVQVVMDRVLAGLQPGEIVLMHIGSNPDDGTTLDTDALAQVIDRIRAAGYGFATLDALLR